MYFFKVFLVFELMLKKNGFIKNQGLSDFLEYHDNFEDYSFIRELNLSNESCLKEFMSLKNRSNVLEKSLASVNSERESCYGIERAFYNNKYDISNSKLKKVQEENISLENNNSKLINRLDMEKSLLDNYNIVVNGDIFKNVKSSWGDFKYYLGTGIVSEEKGSFNLLLPIYASYSLDNPIAKISFMGNMTASRKGEKPHHIESIKNSSSFLDRKFGDNSKIITGKEKYEYSWNNFSRFSSKCTFETEFFSNLSSVGNEIEKAKKIFGKNIYVVSNAYWKRESGRPVFDRKPQTEDDFMVVGYSPNTERIYLISEK